MARVSQRNLNRFRTKKEICSDVAKVLSMDLHSGTKHAVLADVVWVWSEFDGKYDGCRFWSVAARAKRMEEKSSKNLCHEHVVPKRIIMQRLLDLSMPTSENVFEILDNLCIGAVITRDEDLRLTKSGLRSKMPENWNFKSVWDRYGDDEVSIAMEVKSGDK